MAKRFSILANKEIDDLLEKIDKLPDLAPGPSLPERIVELTAGLQGLVDEVSALETARQEQFQTIAQLRADLNHARADRAVEDLWAKIDRLPDPNAVPKSLLKRADAPTSMKVIARDPNGRISLFRVKVGSDQFNMQALRDLNGSIAEFAITRVGS